jgi:hypothetical protein
MYWKNHVCCTWDSAILLKYWTRVSPVFALCSYGKGKYYIGFEVLTTAVMKNSIFWEYRHTVRWRSTDVSEEHLASIFNHEFGGDMFLRNVCWLSNGLHGVTFQKIEVFKIKVGPVFNYVAIHEMWREWRYNFLSLDSYKCSEFNPSGRNPQYTSVTRFCEPHSRSCMLWRRQNIVAYLLRAETVEPEKQPLPCNDLEREAVFHWKFFHVSKKLSHYIR